MRAIPVDDRRMVFQLAGPPRRQEEPNRFTGEISYDVDLFVLVDDRADVVRVSVPESGLGKDLKPMTVVQVIGLTAREWVKPDGRRGTFFSAEAIQPANTKALAA
jgi:hypothetical protein